MWNGVNAIISCLGEQTRSSWRDGFSPESNIFSYLGVMGSPLKLTYSYLEVTGSPL